MTLDLGRFEALTFDCYGTLIDWETGILAALGALLRSRGARIDEEALLTSFAKHETDVEAGPYRPYREVLAEVARRVAHELGVSPSDAEVADFGASVRDWPPFDDSAAALGDLAGRYRLGVITNCDDDLFAVSAERLDVRFDEVITAQQVGAYKPATPGFEAMFERLDLPRERILHVAQSLFHDHVPAKGLGLSTVWVDRRGGRAGWGATPPAAAQPDLKVTDMATLAQLATASSGAAT